MVCGWGCSRICPPNDPFFRLFSLLFFLPYELINCQGLSRRFRPLCLAPFLFLCSSHFSFLLVSFLGANVHQPLVVPRLCHYTMRLAYILLENRVKKKMEQNLQRRNQNGAKKGVMRILTRTARE